MIFENSKQFENPAKMTVLYEELWNPCAKSDIWSPKVKPVKWRAKIRRPKTAGTGFTGGEKMGFNWNLLNSIQIRTLQLWLYALRIRKMSEVLSAESIASLFNHR
jgi:hypothetical protein